MAKRANLSFDALKQSKVQPATEAAPSRTTSQPLDAGDGADPKRGRGRPPKRPADSRIYGMTLRVPGELRRALRRLAEDETDARGSVVSIHDLILEAVGAYLIERNVRRGD
jgi:hypothetical protein